MSLSAMMNDNIELLKKDGSHLFGLKANVQPNKIFMNAGTVVVEPGDLILRKMSNGAEETYRVIDPGFYEKFHGIAAHYQMEVHKLGLPEAKQAIQNVTFNISGPNARINQNSIDNSTNIVQIDSEAIECLDAIRVEISKLQISEDERGAAHQVIDAVEDQFKVGTPKKAVVSALLGALPHVATIAALVSAILARF